MKKIKWEKAVALCTAFLTAAILTVPGWAAGKTETGTKPAAESSAAAEISAAMETKPAAESSAAGTGFSGEEIRIESLGLELETPKGWVTITSEMTADNPVFSENHMDGAAMLENYQANGVLIDSINMEERIELNVTSFGKDKNIIHLTQFSEEDVNQYAQQLISSDNTEGVNFLDYEICQVGDVRFIKGDAQISTGGSVVGNGEQYYTIVNGNRLCFQMFSFDGELSEEWKTAFAAMMDSVRFDSLQEAGPMSLARGGNPILEQLSFQHLLRNIIILLGAILLGYYGVGAVKKKKR